MDEICQNIDQAKMEQMANNYFVQKSLDDSMKSEKTSIYLPGVGVTSELIKLNSKRCWTHVKKMNMSEN